MCTIRHNSLLVECSLPQILGTNGLVVVVVVVVATQFNAMKIPNKVCARDLSYDTADNCRVHETGEAYNSLMSQGGHRDDMVKLEDRVGES